MIKVFTLKEYDEYISEQISKAKRDYPGYVQYEITEMGELFLWSLGAYPTIIKEYCQPITIE